MFILMPAEAQEDPKLNNGCWVRLIDKDARQQVTDIARELGFVKSIDSLQVDCTA